MVTKPNILSSQRQETYFRGRQPSCIRFWQLCPMICSGGGTENEWAPFDILGHLIHGERTDWIPRARIILAQGDDRAFVPFDRLAEFQASKGKSIDELLKEFHQVRHESLETLISWNLSGEELALKGVHPEFGEVSLSELIASWVADDMTHIRQIATCIAKRFGPYVGPWK